MIWNGRLRGPTRLTVRLQSPTVCCSGQGSCPNRTILSGSEVEVEVAQEFGGFVLAVGRVLMRKNHSY